LLLWDESVLEKPESIQLEGLCAVRSSKAPRITRIKPGYYNPPGGPPICVPGMRLPRDPLAWQEWSSHLDSDEAVDNARHLGYREAANGDSLAGCVSAGLGTAGTSYRGIRGLQAVAFLGECFQRQLRFIVRWHKGYHLRDADGRKRSPGRISGRRRAFGERQVWDARRRQWWKARCRGHPRHPSRL
jgi:hypothetical protein